MTIVNSNHTASRSAARRSVCSVGAEVLRDGGVRFRVWAPRRKRVRVVLEGGSDGAPAGDEGVSLEPEGNGYFSAFVQHAAAGTRYGYRLDEEDALYPDPASRYQPEGPHGPSEVVDPTTFSWTDDAWPGVRPEGQVLYEMHIGTFTQEGTWRAAIGELEELASLGVTVIELMPVAEFSGTFGWGYDGVDLFAPSHLYGSPDDLRRFVDRAHALGIGVILDVVYNHLGPDGCYLGLFAPDYFTDRYDNEWGDAINFDGENAGPVREFFADNAAYWVHEFHMDGLRLDATQQIFDSSPSHIISDIAGRVREAAGGRSAFLVAENEPQDVRLIRPPREGGHGLDALWNDDFHHSVMVALTGRREAYYTDYFGSPQELIALAKWGFLYQGQYYTWQRKRRGTPSLGVRPTAFVTYVQNHDQVANSAAGVRVHALTSPGLFRAMTAYLLLGPGTPMLFQGQEFGASSPFFYFADHGGELGDSVRRGRLEFLAQFPSITDPEVRQRLADPGDPETFRRSKLDLTERRTNAHVYDLHRDLLRLRREDPVFANPEIRVDGAVLSPEAFVLRLFGGADGDRLLIVNLGGDLHLEILPEPLLAPPTQIGWEMLWSSESPRYGGNGTGPVDTGADWHIPGQAAVVLTSAAAGLGTSPPWPNGAIGGSRPTGESR